jgi:N-dimethylarginine dimethylaminohydrolase
MKKTALKLLMCSPAHYAIRYVINPWMKLSRQIDHTRAQLQWKSLFDLLSGLGCRIHLIHQVRGLPDMVFTANAGLTVKKKVFLARFRYKERKPEAEHFRKWFTRNGFRVIELPYGIFFEGAGDALSVGTTLFAGYRFRSDIRAHTFIAETLGTEVLSLELAKKRFYHLDTCFTPLSSQSALYYPPAFDRYGQKVIEENIPDPIPVPRKEAYRFVCNAVVAGRDVVIHQHCPEIGQKLADRGFRVHETDLSEFIKAGGSAKCLTLSL